MVDTEEGMAVAVGIEEGMAVAVEEDTTAVAHTVVDIEEGRVVVVVHIAVGIEVVFVADIETEVTMVVMPAVEAVMDIQEDSLAGIALEAANIADLTMNIGVDIQD